MLRADRRVCRPRSAPADDGPTQFARYASPPNRLGYCGPTGADDFAELVAAGAEEDLRHAAREFRAAFPYLELLAGAGRGRDPLTAEVVDAYWVGNALLQRVSTHDFGRSVDDRFRRRAGADWCHVRSAAAGGLANHAFHVLVASPWVGLMRDGIVDEPLAIVDSCRISWGRVVASLEGELLVRRTPMIWIDGRLAWGPTRLEVVTTSVEADVGDTVSVHWGHACEVLDPSRRRWLIAVTTSQMALAARIGRPC